MIAWSVETEIRRLLAEGRWSIRRISKLTGASRGTVAAVAHDRGARKRGTDAAPPWPREDAPRRCMQCKRLVHHPCLACHIQDLSHGGRAIGGGADRRPSCDAPPASELQRQGLRLSLRPDDRLRYQEIRLQLEARRLIVSDSSAVEADWK